MMRLNTLFEERSARRLLQVGLAGCAIGAGAVALADARVARVIAAVLLALIGLIALKGVLVLGVALRGLRADAAGARSRSEQDVARLRRDVARLSDDVETLARGLGGFKEQLSSTDRELGVHSAALADNSASVVRLSAAIADHELRLGPDAEAAQLLVQAAEPLVAQVAIVHNEVLAMRDAIERVDRRVGGLDETAQPSA